MRPATTEKVAVAWLASLPGFNASMVGTELPSDNSTWAASGFVTVSTVGGSPNIYLPFAAPVVGLQFWAVSPDTGLPPWAMAGELAETVRAGCYDTPNIGRTLTPAYCDQQARVMSAYLLAEPRRSYGDVGDYACITVDLALPWSTR